ncbi:hypothetical protein Tco_0936709, partial [Tanacetum coccineum]
DTSTPSDVLRQFTPPSQQGIETRKEPTVIVQMWASVQMSGGVYRNMADRTTVPISRIFNRFRNMRINNIQADSNLQTEPPYTSIRWSNQQCQYKCEKVSDNGPVNIPDSGERLPTPLNSISTPLTEQLRLNL